MVRGSASRETEGTTKKNQLKMIRKAKRYFKIGRQIVSHASRFTIDDSRLTSHVSRLTLLVLLLASCKPSPQYQDHFNVPGGAWNSKFQPQFDFDVDDTSAGYQLFLLIRHTDAYPFSNIWLTVESRGPRDSSFRKVRAEVPLAAASGQWLGRGMGEVWEQRVSFPILLSGFTGRLQKGRYTIRLTQDMRRDPLPEVLTVGLRLEKLPHLPNG